MRTSLPNKAIVELESMQCTDLAAVTSVLKKATELLRILLDLAA